MKKLVILALLLFCSSLASGMSKPEFERVMALLPEKKLEEVEAFLNKNKRTLKTDPEYYVILVNYTFSKAYRSQIFTSTGKPQEGDLALSDTKTGKPAGFIRTKEWYDEKTLLDGIAKVNKGLPYFENRLDIHFGLTTMAEKSKNWKVLGDVLANILKTSKKIDNKWIWGPINSMSGEPKKFMLDNIQPRISSMFYADTKAADEALIRISQLMIQYYPESIYGYANLGTYYFANKDYAKAKEFYQNVLTINPNDEVVKKNLKALNNAMKKQ